MTGERCPDNRIAERVFPAELSVLDEVTDFAGDFAEEIGFSMKAASQIRLALEEIFVNVASYAYSGAQGTVEVSVEALPSGMKITLRDSGTPFDPLSGEEPDITQGADEREIGGLGIFMTRKLMDELSYEYSDGKNCFSMTKRFE